MNIKIILYLILLLALVVRFWNLSNYPAGFNADEAAIGYNSYSLIQTGKDEYGDPFPLAFKSFADYKPGLYFYMVIPFIWFLGLTELAVRIPSAIFGVGTVLIIYLLANKLFKSHGIGLISALLLSITPWHIHFSRGGWESNVATFFITLGVWLHLKINEGKMYLFLSLLSFLAAMYTYQSPRLIVPVLVLGLFLLNWRSHIKNLKQNLIVYLCLIVLSIPLILQFTSGGGSARFSGLSFLSDLGPISRTNELRGEHSNPSSLDAIFIHNKLTAYLPNYLMHYLDHFRPDFLFINGDEVIRNRIPEVGQFYLIMSLLLVSGLIALTRIGQGGCLIILWLLVAPLAASLTFQTPNALRSHNMVIPFILIMSMGLYYLSQTAKGYIRYLVIIFIALALMFEFTHYLESYFIHYPKRYPLSWEYGFKEMVNKLNLYETGYQQVVITDRYDQPYILVLFYKKYDPVKYQPQAVLTERDKFNFSTVRNFDKYQFRSFKKDEVANSKDTLYIASPDDIKESELKDFNVLDTINFPNDKPAFIFLESKIK